MEERFEKHSVITFTGNNNEKVEIHSGLLRMPGAGKVVCCKIPTAMRTSKRGENQYVTLENTSLSFSMMNICVYNEEGDIVMRCESGIYFTRGDGYMNLIIGITRGYLLGLATIDHKKDAAMNMSRGFKKIILPSSEPDLESSDFSYGKLMMSNNDEEIHCCKVIEKNRYLVLELGDRRTGRMIVNSRNEDGAIVSSSEANLFSSSSDEDKKNYIIHVAKGYVYHLRELAPKTKSN